MPNVRYLEDKQIWRMDARYNGGRKTFYSKAKSERRAQTDCDRQFVNWIEQNEEESNISWLNAWNEYIEDYSERWKETSTRKLKERGKTYLVSKFKNKKLKDVSKLDYQRIIDKNNNLAKKTLEGIVTTISSFGTFCLKKGYIKNANEYRDFLIPAKASTKKKRSLDPKELKNLMSSDRDNECWYIPMFRFLVFTGLRRGELCALQADRDLSLPYLHVRQSISNELVLGTPKNGKTRSEYLNALALQALELHNKNRLEKGFDSEYLFCSSTGQRISPKVITAKWKEYRERHNLGEITLHELRHSFSSYASKTLELDALKEMLGHSEHMPTERVYVHDVPLTPQEFEIKKEIDKEQANKLEDIFSLILNS